MSLIKYPKIPSSSILKKPRVKQKSLLSLPKITKKDVILSPWFAFVIGQLMFLLIYSLWKIIVYGGVPGFDVVLFPGLAGLGFYDISIAGFRYSLVKILGVVVINITILLAGYFYARSYGKWILNWALQILVILNLAMVIYW